MPIQVWRSYSCERGRIKKHGRESEVDADDGVIRVAERGKM